MALHNLFGELALDDTVAASNALLTLIEGNTDGLEGLLTAILAELGSIEGNTDDVEALLTSAVAALGAIQTNTNDLAGILAAVDTLEALITAGNALLTDIDINTDGLEALATAGNATAVSILAAVDQLEGYLDTLEALIAATNAALAGLQASLTTIIGHVDGIEALIGTTNTTLSSILTAVDQLEGYTDGIEAALAAQLTATTDGTQKTQVVDAGGQALDIAVTGAALVRLDRNAHIPDASAWAQLTDSFVMVGGLVSGSAIGGAAAIRAGSRAWFVDWVNNAGVSMGSVANPVAVDGSKAEDAAHVSGDRGAFILGVRNDADATRTSTDGDYSPVSVDLAGRIKAVIASSALPAGAATEATSAAILAAVDQLEGYLDTVEALLGTGNTNTGTTATNTTAILAAVDQLEGYVDTLEALITAGNATLVTIAGHVDGLETLLGTTNTTLASILTKLDDGTQKTQVVDGAGDVLAITAGGAGMVQLANNAQVADVAVWTPFVDSLVMCGGLIFGSSFAGAAAIRTGSRAWLTEMVDAAGTAFGTAANPITVRGEKVEDSPHVSGDNGILVFGVRNDTNAVRTSNDNDYSSISTDSAGRVKVVVDSTPTGAATEATQLQLLRAANAALSNVAASAASTQLLAANANRVGATLFNDSAATAYVKFGTTASATSFTYRMRPFSTLELATPAYSGRIDAIWTSATGAMRVTEMTP